MTLNIAKYAIKTTKYAKINKSQIKKSIKKHNKISR